MVLVRGMFVSPQNSCVETPIPKGQWDLWEVISYQDEAL